MPALLVHLTLAGDTLAHPEAPAALAQAGAAERGALLLGAILPDLPYHARFGRQLVRHLLGRDYLQSEWGDLWHARGTGRLALALLAHAERAHLLGAERQQVLALAAGYLSHHAVDRVVHPLINQLVKRLLLPGEPPAVLHARLERYQNLLFHRDRLGVDLAGSPHPRRMVGEVAGPALLAPLLEPPLAAALRAACLETHGRAPSPRELRDFLFGIAAYGHLMSSPAGRRERLRGDLDALRRDYYHGPGVDLETPLQHAVQLTVEYWRAAADLLAGERLGTEQREVFLRRVPDVDLATGA